MPGQLSPLQLIAGEGLLQDQGLGVNAEFLTTVALYNNTALIQPFLTTLANGSVGNILSNATISSLESLASNSCPSLSNSVPVDYSSLTITITGFSGLLVNTANRDTGNNNVSKFIQAINICQGYSSTTNTFINSAVNSQTYLADTFTGMTDLITGDITTINLYTTAFANDLKNLGRLINLANLDNLGSPLALLQNIVRYTGSLPQELSIQLVALGVPQQIVLNLTDPDISVTDSIQKLMYQAMTLITNTNGTLGEVLAILKVTTPNITTMADLLNPLILFPTSFSTLKTTTIFGPAPIYVDGTQSVNTNLATQLPSYALLSTV